MRGGKRAARHPVTQSGLGREPGLGRRPQLWGPFASLRLKHWRRGIQDADYLTLAAAVDPARTAQIVDAMVPQALWEYGVSDPRDPTWVRADISWSIDPDDWETARAELANIIEGTSSTTR